MGGAVELLFKCACAAAISWALVLVTNAAWSGARTERVQVFSIGTVESAPWELADPPPPAAVTLLRKENVHVFGMNQGLFGPEGAAVVGDAMYVGTRDGKLMRLSIKSTAPMLLGNPESVCGVVGGRILGLHSAGGDDLILAEAVKGLMKVNVRTCFIEVLTTVPSDCPPRYVNDLDIARNGDIFFSDSSAIAPFRVHPDVWSTMEAAQADIFSGTPTGRLLKYDMEKKNYTTVLDGISYANGVALSAAEDFVLVVESARYRVLRVSLDATHEPVGEAEVVFAALPAVPDGISRTRNGSFLLSLLCPRNKVLDFLHAFPAVKQVLWQLPKALRPKPKKLGAVVQFRVEDGNTVIERVLLDEHGEAIFGVSSAMELEGGAIVLGGLEREGVSIWES